ncbi:MAG: hypothetical protein ACE5E9_11515 [Nitrospinaceae bacterium]
MKKRWLTLWMAGWIFVSIGTGSALAHVTPVVKLSSTRDTIARLLPQGKLSLKDVRLTPDQMQKLKSQGNWESHENHYKFFVSRAPDNQLQRAAVFITEYSRHGPVVVAVSLDPSGKVVDAILTDIQVEPLAWVEPLLQENYMREFRGKGGNMALALDTKWKTRTSGMTQSYALIIANAVKRAAQLFDVVFK